MDIDILTLLLSFLGAITGGTIAAIITMERKIRNGSIIKKREVYHTLSEIISECKRSSDLNDKQFTSLASSLNLYSSNGILAILNKLFSLNDENTALFSMLKRKLFDCMRKELRVKGWKINNYFESKYTS